MVDLTHLQLAHRLLTHDANLGRLERAERYARAQAYATLSVAEALNRIADAIEAEAAGSIAIETYDGQKTVVPSTRAEALARRFHETYERLAPDFGYETRKASAVPWEQVPENNRRLMTAVASEILGDT